MGKWDPDPTSNTVEAVTRLSASVLARMQQPANKLPLREPNVIVWQHAGLMSCRVAARLDWAFLLNLWALRPEIWDGDAMLPYPTYIGARRHRQLARDRRTSTDCGGVAALAPPHVERSFGYPFDRLSHVAS